VTSNLREKLDEEADAEGMEVDEAASYAEPTLDIDIRVIVQNVKDTTADMEVWRVQVIHTDYENRPQTGGDYVRVADPAAGEGRTKMIRVPKDRAPYRVDIPVDYIAALHAEPNTIEATVRRMTTEILGEANTPQSTLDSVAASPMTAFDPINTTTQTNLNLPDGNGMKQTQYAVSMQLPANDEENRDKAGVLIEGLVSTPVSTWANMTGLQVIMVTGVQDKVSYIKGVRRMQMLKRDAPPTEEEKLFLARKFGTNWNNGRPDDIVDALMQYRMWMRDIDQEEAIAAMTARERRVYNNDDDRARVQRADE